jgi:hypothetical protein
VKKCEVKKSAKFVLKKCFACGFARPPDDGHQKENAQKTDEGFSSPLMLLMMMMVC